MFQLKVESTLSNIFRDLVPDGEILKTGISQQEELILKRTKLLQSAKPQELRSSWN